MDVNNVRWILYVTMDGGVISTLDLQVQGLHPDRVILSLDTAVPYDLFCDLQKNELIQPYDLVQYSTCSKSSSTSTRYECEYSSSRARHPLEQQQCRDIIKQCVQ